MREKVLVAERLTIGYARGSDVVREVYSGLDCAVRRGELVSMIGQNGIGKSTFLKTLAGLQPALSGRVLLYNQDIHSYGSMERASMLGLVLTDRVRVGAMKVRSLVSLGRYPYTPWTGSLGRKDREAVDAALDMTGLTPLADRLFSKLSDGEKQKVMLARAVAQEPSILILDEPTAFLDLPRRIEVLSILKKLTRSKDIAVLLSTHDLDMALKTTDLLWILSSDSFISGAPEDLVLNGSLERAFSWNGLTFNLAEGNFIMHEGHGTVVYVTGEGLEALWTQRALERDGYSVRTGEGDPQVRVISTDRGNKPSWTFEINGERHRASDIFELISALRIKIRS